MNYKTKVRYYKMKIFKLVNKKIKFKKFSKRLDKQMLSKKILIP